MSEIKELYAWVIIDPSGVHGVMAIQGSLGLMQAVASKRRVADMGKRDAEMAAKMTGLPVRLQRFVLAETVDEA